MTYTVWAWLTIYLASLWYTTARILPTLEHRPNLVVLSDPLYRILPGQQLSGYIAGVLYGSIMIFIIACVRGCVSHPSSMLCCYTCHTWVRTFTIWVTPLRYHPELDTWKFVDGFQRFWTQKDEARNDLFYSGHTATLALMACWLNDWRLSAVAWGVTLMMGFMLIVNRIHYTTDVLGAIWATQALSCWIRWFASTLKI